MGSADQDTREAMARLGENALRHAAVLIALAVENGLAGAKGEPLVAEVKV